MYGWQVAVGIVNTLGCVTSLAALCKKPKKLGPLPMFMGLLSFSIFFLEAFNVWNTTTTNLVDYPFYWLKVLRACNAFQYPLFCLMWWSILYLFGSLHFKTDHPHMKKGAPIYLVMCLFIVIFYTVNIVRVYDQGLLFGISTWEPNIYATYSMWRNQFWMRWIFGIITFFKILSLSHRFRLGQLPHVSHHCITKGKLMVCLILKVALLITYCIW
jgi:hypothetical protein